MEHPTRAFRSIASLSWLYAYAPILKAGILESFNDFPSIVALAQLLVMNKVIPAPMLPLAHIAVTIQVRVDAMHERKAAEERIATPDLGSLLANRLCKAVEALSRTHDNAPVLPVLCNDSGGKFLDWLELNQFCISSMQAITPCMPFL